MRVSTLVAILRVSRALVFFPEPFFSPLFFFFFNDTAPTEIYTLSLHDALPISPRDATDMERMLELGLAHGGPFALRDRKSTRLNSSHLGISYAVFCLKKKNKPNSASYTNY